MGHEVTVFEKAEKIGGLLRYGIPDYKLEKSVIDRRIELMRIEGIQFESDVNIGEDLSARYLKKSFDVILITAGAGQPRDLRAPGRGLERIHFATEYLTQSNQRVSGELKNNKPITTKGKQVLVIGGGDTGSDCIGTAHRQGAKEVIQFEILEQPRKWNKSNNPEWPNWPVILRTSSSHEEGAKREWGILTKQFSGRGIKVEKVHCCRVEWEKDKNGFPGKMKEIPGSEFQLKVDLVLLAMGFVHIEHNRLLTDLGVEFDERSNIQVEKNYSTNIDGVFSAGDANTGASLVVRGIFHGQEAAKAIDKYLA